MKGPFARSAWFRKSRFGMFIHWGLYAVPGRDAWVRSDERMPSDEYDKYLSLFNPTACDPRQWARAAKAAGMRYMVLTAKHHDGFCLFDTKYTDFNSVKACGRDLVRDYVDAVRTEGLAVGLYFSLLDWRHKDYPKYGDLYHPMRDNADYKDEVINFDAYLDFMHGQIEELVTNYGKLDILWFDYSYGDLRGEAWRARELTEMVRRHQPDAIMDNRLETSGEGFGSIVTEHPSPFCGDFVSPEQIIPAEGVRNARGQSVPWELCTTLNNCWGYNPRDLLYKPAPLLVRKLVECVSKDGNMILNVGPDALGRFNEPSLNALNAVGQWMEKNSESIYGCGYAGIPKPEWGRYTRNGRNLYAHVFEPPIGPLALTGVNPDEVESITLLRDGSEVRRGDSFATKAYPGTLFVSLGEIPYFTYPLPDAIDTVLKIALKEKLPCEK